LVFINLSVNASWKAYLGVTFEWDAILESVYGPAITMASVPIIFALVWAGLTLMESCRRALMKKKPPADIENLMQQMNKSAFEVATSFKVKLDYTDASVQRVESILGQLHNEYMKTKDDSGLRGISLFFAAYIGEVIRRKLQGGTWSRNHPVVGDDSFPFNWNGSDLFLLAWCQKRIFDGELDDVWSKYRVCVLEKLKTSKPDVTT
jgi:hypothetical protein